MSKVKNAMKKCNIRYFSQLTAKQKDEAQKLICSILAAKNPKFISPALWGVLFDVDFDSIIATKNEADKYCKGKCFRHKNLWIPLSVKNLN